MKRVTIKDIASHMRLSVSTVSRALADDKNIRKETKQRVFEAASELGYRRNPLAVSLRTGHTDTIGVLVREMLTPCAAMALDGIQSVVQEFGINIIVANSDNDPARELKNLQMLENSMVDGIIIDACGCDSNPDEFRRLMKKGIPHVFVSHAPRGVEADLVTTDDYVKAKELICELLRCGRRRIVNVKGKSGTVYNLDLHKAYNDALLDAGLPCRVEMSVEADSDFKSGQEVVDRLIDSGVEFDAIFSYTELVGLGIMHRLQERGLSVPGDVSVVTFGGTSLSTFVFPPMAAVERPLREMGRIAATLLLDRIRHPHRGSDPKRNIVCSEVKIRKSL